MHNISKDSVIFSFFSFFLKAFFIISLVLHFFRNFYLVAVPLKMKAGTVKNLKSPGETDIEEVRCFKSNSFVLKMVYF